MKKEVKLIIALVVIAVIAIGVISYFVGRGAGRDEFLPEEKELPDNTSQTDSIAENLLHSLNNNDYSSFSKDFSNNLKLIMNQQTFQQTKSLIDETSGQYLSKAEPSLYEYQGYDLYQYPCTFEKEAVALSIYFQPNSILLEGLTFDSENLRAAVQQ